MNINLSRFIVFFICGFYLLSPAATVINFTILNGTHFIVYAIILAPTIVSLIGISTIPHKFFRFSSWLIVSITLLITFVSFGALRSFSDPIDSIASLFRFYSSIIFFTWGTYSATYLIENKSVEKIAFYGIVGGVFGILSYFLTKSLGYSMTHSVTADGMLAPLFWFFSKNPTIVMLSATFITVILSGKSANLIASIISLAAIQLKSIKAVVVTTSLFFTFGLLLNEFYEQILPYKLVTRIDIIKSLLDGTKSLEDGAGFSLTSGRYDEILFLLNKWKQDSSIFYFGEGLVSKVEIYEGISKNTAHMSYMKIIDMIGVVGFLPLLTILIYFLFIAIKNIRNPVVSLYSLFVISQITLSFFQYSLLQDPIFWISAGVLYKFTNSRNKFLN